MQIKELIKKLKKYPDNYLVTINDPNPKTEGSRNIWYVEEDIKNGQPQNIQCCPIALALKRTFKTDMVEVKKNDENNEVILQVDDNEYDKDYVSNFNDIVSFVNEYDRGQAVEPFTFEINL